MLKKGVCKVGVPKNSIDKYVEKLNKWVEKDEDFFIPVKVMSKVFRGKFLYYLKQEKLDFYRKNKYLENPASYNSLIQELYNKDWIVYCKEPFNNANVFLKNLI